MIVRIWGICLYTVYGFCSILGILSVSNLCQIANSIQLQSLFSSLPSAISSLHIELKPTRNQLNMLLLCLDLNSAYSSGVQPFCLVGWTGSAQLIHKLDPAGVLSLVPG